MDYSINKVYDDYIITGNTTTSTCGYISSTNEEVRAKNSRRNKDKNKKI